MDRLIKRNREKITTKKKLVFVHYAYWKFCFVFFFSLFSSLSKNTLFMRILLIKYINIPAQTNVFIYQIWVGAMVWILILIRSGFCDVNSVWYHSNCCVLRIWMNAVFSHYLCEFGKFLVMTRFVLFCLVYLCGILFLSPYLFLSVSPSRLFFSSSLNSSLMFKWKLCENHLFYQI